MTNRSLLPPMGAIHAFVESAATENFSTAGARLGLSQSAISRQIAVIEAMAGTPLFERRGRRVVLNAAGRQVHAALVPALDQIAGAMRAVRARDSGVNAVPLNSGYQRLLVAPGLRVQLTRKLSLYADVELPVAQYVNSAATPAVTGTAGQLAAKALFKLQLNYGF